MSEVLNVPANKMSRWMHGEHPVPEPVFRMLVDFLSDMESGQNLPRV